MCYHARFLDRDINKSNKQLRKLDILATRKNICDILPTSTIKPQNQPQNKLNYDGFQIAAILNIVLFSGSLKVVIYIIIIINKILSLIYNKIDICDILLISFIIMAQ